MHEINTLPIFIHELVAFFNSGTELLDNGVINIFIKENDFRVTTLYKKVKQTNKHIKYI